MGLDFDPTEGQTSLEDEEKEGLLIPTITTRLELDEFEQHNIEQAIEWTLRSRFNAERMFSERFVREVHRRMYGSVWKWAGEFRTTEKNIGIDPVMIPVELRKLLGDAAFWVENDSFVPDEIAIRFKHRLVQVHCFPNGNGRHSRLMADIVASHVLGELVFSWGSESLVAKRAAREEYLAAVREADEGNLSRLIVFARS